MAQGDTVFLTGATGNVGSVILEHLLQTTSYNVNIVLRNAAKQIPLFRKRFTPETSIGRLAFTSIPDMTVPEAFDDAAASATAIIHCATPIGSDNDFFKDMIEPTWTIDHSILTAAKKSATVTRVIICGTLLQTLGGYNLFNPAATITDASYNSTTLEEAKAGPWRSAYMYSKTNAERKAWAWYEEQGGKEGTGFDIVMLLPPMITGRSPQVGYTPSNGPGGIGRIYHTLLESKTAEDMDATFPIFMDTDDVARAHVLALEPEKVPGNQRYLLASPETVDLRSVVARMKEDYPELADKLPDVGVDDEGHRSRMAKLAKVDTSKSDVVFGTKWKSAYDSIKEIVLDAIRWEKANDAAKESET